MLFDTDLKASQEFCALKKHYEYVKLVVLTIVICWLSYEMF